MNYKSFLDNLLAVDTDIDWRFPFAKEDNISEIDFYDKINLNELLNNVAFSFLPKKTKQDIYDYVKDIQRIEERTLHDIDIYLVNYYKDMNNRFSNSIQTIEKLVESILDWINVLGIKISKKTIDKLYNFIPTENKYFWFYLIEKLYLLNLYQESYYLINQVQIWGYIDDDDELFEDIHLYKLICLNAMKFHKNKSRQEEIISIAEGLENYNDVSLITKLEYYTFNKEQNKFDDLISQNIDMIREYSIDELINIFELSILCGAKESYNIINEFLKSRDVPYYEKSVDYDIYMLLTSIYYGEISKVLKLAQKIIQEYPYAYDFDHILWFYRKNKKVNTKIKSFLKSVGL